MGERPLTIGGREGKKIPSQPNQVWAKFPTGGLLGLFLSFLSFSFQFRLLGERARWVFPPCPALSLPLFPSFLCVLVLLGKKSQTQRIHQMCEGAVRLHCICIAKLLQYKPVLTARMWVALFFLGAQKLPGGNRRASLRLRRPAFPHRTAPVRSLLV